MSDLIESLLADLDWSQATPSLEDSAKARIRNALKAKDKRIAELEADYRNLLAQHLGALDRIEAKDKRIADLKADNERLRAVLNRIANDEYEWEYGVSASEVAREALAKLQEQSDAG